MNIMLYLVNRKYTDKNMADGVRKLGHEACKIMPVTILIRNFTSGIREFVWKIIWEK